MRPMRAKHLLDMVNSALETKLPGRLADKSHAWHMRRAAHFALLSIHVGWESAIPLLHLPSTSPFAIAQNLGQGARRAL